MSNAEIEVQTRGEAGENVEEATFSDFRADLGREALVKKCAQTASLISLLTLLLALALMAANLLFGLVSAFLLSIFINKVKNADPNYVGMYMVIMMLVPLMCAGGVVFLVLFAENGALIKGVAFFVAISGVAVALLVLLYSLSKEIDSFTKEEKDAYYRDMNYLGCV